MSTITIHTCSAAELAAFYAHARELGVALSDESGQPSWPPAADRLERAREAISPRKHDPDLQRRVDAARRAISGGTDDEVKERAAATSAAMKGRPDDEDLADRVAKAKAAIGR